MPDVKHPFWDIILKTIVTHTVTYFIAGVLAMTLFNYGERFADPDFEYPMRLVSDPWVMAGPLFQPIRGLLFGLVFYALRSVLFRPRDGWLLIWALLVVVGILSTFGPAPGSIEGMIYTTSPFMSHLNALPEILFQSFLLSVILWYWVRNPDKRWLTWLMGIAFAVMVAMLVLGILAATGRLST